MERTPVQSSDIKSLGYDEATKTLEVEFLKGSVYQYKGVLPLMYENFLKAKSKGRFLAYIIKPFFEVQKVD